MEQDYLSPEEVAQRLRVKATTVRRWIATGALEAETVHEGKRKRHRIKKVVIETIETSHQPNTTTIASWFPE
jgi:excisionase family DNA binding protein